MPVWGIQGHVLERAQQVGHVVCIKGISSHFKRWPGFGPPGTPVPLPPWSTLSFTKAPLRVAWLPRHCPSLLCVCVCAFLSAHRCIYIFYLLILLFVCALSVGALSLKIISLLFAAFDFPPTIWFHASIIPTRSEGKQNTCNLHAVTSADNSNGFLFFFCVSVCFFFVLFFTSVWKFASAVHINTWYEGEGRKGEKNQWGMNTKSLIIWR